MFIPIALWATGCGVPEDSTSTDGTVPATRQFSDAVFQIVAVVGTSQPPCSSGVNIKPELSGTEVVECLNIGPTVVGGSDVKIAKLVAATRVAVTLKPSGTQKLDRLLRESTSGKRIAILSYSTVLEAPSAVEPTSDGQILIGGITEQQARSLVGDLGGDPNQKVAQSDADRLTDRAKQVCDQHRPASVGGASITAAAPRTAGEITTTSQRQLNRTVPPWDTFPVDTFVADCVYASQSGSAAPPISVCPDGKVVLLGGNRIFLVDEGGNVTPDPEAATSDPSLSTC